MPHAHIQGLEERLNTVQLDGVELHTWFEGPVETLDLLVDRLVEVTREELLEAFLLGDESIDVGGAVDFGEEVTEGGSLGDLLIQILNQDDLAGEELDTGLGSGRELGLVSPDLDVSEFIHLADEGGSLIGGVHVRVDLGQRVRHVLIRLLRRIEPVLLVSDQIVVSLGRL